MASDRTRELAKGWLITNFDEDVQVPAFEHLDSLVALLDAFERETRLDEAGWWHNCPHDCEQFPERESCQRIIKLAAQPTPEVKK